MECYTSYLNDCDKYMKIQSYRKAVEMGQNPHEDQYEDLAKQVAKYPHLMCSEAKYGIKNSF